MKIRGDDLSKKLHLPELPSVSRASTHAAVKGAPRRSGQRAARETGFNSRAREGRDQSVDDLALITWPVSIHAPVKGATICAAVVAVGKRVSIHAPVKGATSFNVHLRPGNKVSIHAPVKGATAANQAALAEGGVSIHAPVKGATGKGFSDASLTEVSIHAPVKGATRSSCTSPFALYCFNSRAREGRDCCAHVSGELWTRFQFTRP